MRKVKAIVISTALVAGSTVVLAGSAYAAITSPASGATLAGSVTVTDSPGGVNKGTACITGGSTKTTINLLNASGGVISQLATNGGGVLSTSFDTHTQPNGNYQFQDVTQNRTGTLICSSSTTTTAIPVTIDNLVNIAYTTATSAPQNTSLTVSATLTDPNLASSVLPGRVLSFSLSGGATVSATTASNGVATATLPISGPPRAANLAVAYAGTTFYDAKTQNVAFTVTKDATTTALAPLTSSVHGQAVQFTATVLSTQGGGTPGGTVQFTDNGSPLGAAVPVPANGIVNSVSTATLSTADHSIVASYSGDPNFLPSSASAIQHVGKAVTATALNATPNPTVSGQATTFTATVAVLSPGAGSPSGDVQFTVDGQPFGTAVALSGTSASLTISNLSVGNHPVSATYNGSADFTTSTSATVTQGVSMDTTSVALSSSSLSSVYGEPVTFSATVTANAPGSGTPTGSIQFSIDGLPLGPPVALVDGVATSSSVSGLGPGAHDISANYAGDVNFSGEATDITQQVAQDTTKSTVTSSVNPSVFGEAVTFHASVAAVAPGAGIPTGQVQFYVDGNPVGAPVGLVNGAADSDPVANLEPGTYSITVSYSGDVDFLASDSAPISQQVNKAATSTSVSSSVNPSVFGQPVTFTATVTAVAPGAGNPTGTITFKDGVTVLGTVAVGPGTGEQASLSTSALVVAPHAISATYNGDGDFLTSSDNLTQTVTRAQSAVVVGSSANPAASGQAITFTAAVSPVAPGAGNPTGAVTFTVNGAPLGSAATVTNGVATSTTFASLSPGTYTISASYSGDGNFVGSSAILAEGTGQQVTKASTTAAVTTSASPAPYASTVTFTATIKPVGLLTGKASGLVQFYDGAELLGSASLVPASFTSDSVATFAYSSLFTGTHTITATYVGNFNFTGSSASVSQAIGAVPTTTALSSSQNPSVYGSTTQFTAVVTAPTGTPAGSITFTDGATTLGTVALTSFAGVDSASLSTSALHAGSHPITATYNAAGPYSGSSASLIQTVVKANTTLSAQVIITDQVALNRDGVRLHLGLGEASAYLTGPNGPIAGQTLTFTTLSFHQFVIPVCTAVTDANGYAHCDVTLNNADNNLPTIVSNGGYQVSFAGNPDYNGSSASGALDE